MGRYNKGINYDAYYLVDISNLKEIQVYAQEFWDLSDAEIKIDECHFFTYDNVDILRGRELVQYGIPFVFMGQSSWLGGISKWRYPLHISNRKSRRTNEREASRKKFRENFNDFINFVTNHQDSYTRTFRLTSNGNYYYVTNPIPKYIREKHYKRIMDCMVTSDIIPRVGLYPTKITELDRPVPIRCGVFIKQLQDNLRLLLKDNKYHQELKNYEKLCLTRSRWNAQAIFQKTETILPIPINF